MDTASLCGPDLHFKPGRMLPGLVVESGIAKAGLPPAARLGRS